MAALSRSAPAQPVNRARCKEVDMRDKKDNATFDLPGFEAAVPLAPSTIEVPRTSARRPRKSSLKQEQLELLDETDASGLPVSSRGRKLDWPGLRVWAQA